MAEFKSDNKVDLTGKKEWNITRVEHENGGVGNMLFVWMVDYVYFKFGCQINCKKKKIETGNYLNRNT